MLGGLFVACLHVKQGEVRVHELFVRPKLFGFMPFGDGGGIVPFPVVGHPQGKLSVPMIRLFNEDRFEPRNGGVVLAGGEIEHRVVVLFLKRRHKSFDNQRYHTIVVAAQAEREL